MMSTPDRPDLAKGLSAENLAPGEMIEGTYEGARVLLARVGDEFYAVGGECTHYGAPLCEGLLRGTTVLCPWHHARFDLASGRATSPPALSGLQRYRVSVQGDRIRVLAPVAPSRESRRPARQPDSVVIVGAGAAGALAAETLRDEGFEGGVTLLEAEPSGPVDRPNLSKDYLAGHAPEEWIPLRPDEFYQERGIELRVGTRAERIDVGAKTLRLSGGEEVGWDALLLATGAAAVRPPVPGADLPHVFTLRSLRDARAIIDAAERSRRVVVVGASFIGLEVAAALRARKLEVHVVAPESTPMERILGPDLGEFIRELHEKNGVHFHLGRGLQAVGRDHVTLSDGSHVAGELVVVGAGVRPEMALADAAGIACDRGVLVDEYLETSAPGVWAAGDLARWPDPWTGERVRIEHWVLAERLGQTAARNILGAGEPFRAVPFFWSRHYDASVHYVGSGVAWDEAQSIGDARHGRGVVLFRRGGRVLAVASVGDPRVSLEAELALESGDPDAMIEWERHLRSAA
jgi:NADPH-dependent 2,4-dienoyl-CoA reductase/sulfur reductase-like enzyme/nitrite reductase/ring-hydroxylating ferredoxin subunit